MKSLSTEGSPAVFRSRLMRRYWALRYWILSAVVVACGAGVVYCILSPTLYASTVVLFVKEPAVVTEPSPFALPDHSPSMKQLFHGATSSQMMEHLLENFDLFHHYRINEADPFRFEKVNAALSRNIRVAMTEMNAISVTVRDRDRDMAAAMANAIFRELQRVTEAQFVAEMALMRKVHYEVITRTEKFSNEQEGALERLFATDPSTGKKENGLMDLELAKLAGQLAVANEDLFEAKRYYDISDAILKKEHLPRLQLVRKAQRDITTSPVRSALWRILLIGTSTFAVSLFVIASRYGDDEEEGPAMERPTLSVTHPEAPGHAPAPVRNGAHA
jgi:hypothetical protein